MNKIFFSTIAFALISSETKKKKGSETEACAVRVLAGEFLVPTGSGSQ